MHEVGGSILPASQNLHHSSTNPPSNGGRGDSWARSKGQGLQKAQLAQSESIFFVFSYKKEIIEHSVLWVYLAFFHSLKNRLHFVVNCNQCMNFTFLPILWWCIFIIFFCHHHCSTLSWASSFLFGGGGISSTTLAPSPSFSYKIYHFDPLFWTISSLLQAEMLAPFGTSFPPTSNPTIFWGKGIHSTLFQFLASIVYNLQKISEAFKLCNKK